MENFIKALSVAESINQSAIGSYKGKIIKCTEIVPNTFQIDFELDLEMEFTPGQYIWLRLGKIIAPDPRGNQRAFSILRHSTDKKNISIVFRRSESNYKKTLINMKPGEEVIIEGPRGFFTISEVKSPTVLIAGGIGVAPFVSILNYMTDINSPRKTLLFINNKNNDRRIYSEEIQNLVKKNKNLRVYELIGEELSWGFIEKNLESSEISINDALWYISGPEEMVNSSYKVLEDHKINPEKIMLDEFKPYKDQSLLHAEVVNKMTQNEFFNLISDRLSVHVAVTDPEGRILFANKAAERATGYKLEEMLGLTPRLWGGLMNREYYTRMWNTIKNDRKTFESQILNRRKNGELYVSEISISPIIENKILVGFLASESDITEIVKTNAKLIDMVGEYEKLNKLMVDREIRMTELKKEIKELKSKNSSIN